jgi:hypothetical protein
VIDPVSIADHAVLQSDRWLFLASLIVCGLGVVATIRWLVTTFAGLTRELSAVIQANTDALKEFRSGTARCRFRNGDKDTPV